MTLSEDTAWGVLCDGCGLLPSTYETREQARKRARVHRSIYGDPKPAVTAVRVRVVLVETAQEGGPR